MLYDALLKPLGWFRVYEAAGLLGYGREENTDTSALQKAAEAIVPPGAGSHLAFSAPIRVAIVEAYAAAIAPGGDGNEGAR